MSCAVVGAEGLSLVAGAEGFDRAFTASADASGMYVRYGIPKFLLVENFVDAGGPVAHADYRSDGTAGSYASLPYPGSTAVGYPGLVALATGVVPPGYPFFASASHPTQPEQVVADPAGIYSLRALAGKDAATGEARLSAPGDTKTAAPASEAMSDVKVEADSIRVQAKSVARGVVLGPLSVLQLASSSVTTYRRGDPSPATTTELSIEGGRAGDLTFSFGRAGLQVAKQGVPLPAAEGLAAINQTVAPAGFQVNFSEPEVREGGATAGALDVVHTGDVPGAGRGTLRIRFGGVSSAIALGAAEGGGDAFLDPVSDTGSPQPEEASSQPFAESSGGPVGGGGQVGSQSDSGTSVYVPGRAAEWPAYGTGGLTTGSPVSDTSVRAESALSAVQPSGPATVAKAPATERAAVTSVAPSFRDVSAPGRVAVVMGIAALLWIGVLAASMIGRMRPWTS